MVAFAEAFLDEGCGVFAAHGVVPGPFRTWYEIWEWPGAELDLFLKMASRISSGVISE